MVPVLHDVEETMNGWTEHAVDWKADGVTAADETLGATMVSADAPVRASALQAAILDLFFT
jgi:hypothetical protein